MHSNSHITKQYNTDQKNVQETSEEIISDLKDDLPKTSEEIKKLLCELSEIYREKMIYEFPVDILQFSKIFELGMKTMTDIIENPVKNIKIYEKFLQEANSLYFASLNRFLGGSATLPIQKFSLSFDDNRFKDPEWDNNVYFESLKRGYYLITKYTLTWLNSISTLDKKNKQQVHFFIKNVLDFLSPSNFIRTNPEVLRATIESNGENLLRGFKNCLEDLVHNKGHISIRTTDYHAFKVGENIACTPGKVIFQNDLMQLIQYLPATETVCETPILFVPPWINKYYILDLSPENSLVKWLVNKGFTVYMISWVNPDKSFANKKFENYMLEGPLAALDIITKTAKVPNVNMVGYCIGGTLLGCTLAYMAQKKDNRAKTASFFMSLLDFSNPGELGIFIDESQLNILDRLMETEGYLDGRLLESAFSFLRPNEMIWQYFINNYLLGREPKKFDLLYWNSDSTNLPFKMYSYYLRNMYLKNILRKPYRIIINDTPINLNDIKIPALFISSKTDHITLWRSVYRSASLLGGPTEFIFSDSGHVRGVVNPPGYDHKYKFRTNERLGVIEPLPKRPLDWLSQAKEHHGSWWPHWVKWLEKHDGIQIPARDPVKMGLTIVEDAPGSYVKKQI